MGLRGLIWPVEMSEKVVPGKLPVCGVGSLEKKKQQSPNRSSLASQAQVMRERGCVVINLGAVPYFRCEPGR